MQIRFSLFIFFQPPVEKEAPIHLLPAILSPFHGSFMCSSYPMHAVLLLVGCLNHYKPLYSSTITVLIATVIHRLHSEVCLEVNHIGYWP